VVNYREAHSLAACNGFCLTTKAPAVASFRYQQDYPLECAFGLQTVLRNDLRYFRPIEVDTLVGNSGTKRAAQH